eukprot:12312164-Karenia_brevis.AAC.1
MAIRLHGRCSKRLEGRKLPTSTQHAFFNTLSNGAYVGQHMESILVYCFLTASHRTNGKLSSTRSSIHSLM